LIVKSAVFFGHKKTHVSFANAGFEISHLALATFIKRLQAEIKLALPEL